MKILDYDKYHKNQIKSLFDLGYFDQVIAAGQNYRFYYPSLLKNKLYHQVDQKLSQKHKLTASQMCWLLMAKIMLDSNYLGVKVKLQATYGQKWVILVDKWIKAQQKSLIQKPLLSKRDEIISHYQYLCQKSTRFSYYNIKQVPVYLLSTQWLSTLYEKSNPTISHISNHSLITFQKLIDTNPKYIHLNYQVKEQCKQDKDYKIITPDVWQFLCKQFGCGLEVKRFTTNQKSPTVEVYYRKLNFAIIQGKYFHANQVQIQTPRFATFQSAIQRLKNILTAYNIVPTQIFDKKLDIIKVKNLTNQKMIDLIQDDQTDKIQNDDQRFQMIDQNFDIQQAQIYAKQQQMILNLSAYNTKKQSYVTMNLFQEIKSLKTIIIREKCLQCGSQSQIFTCICKSVHFCSSTCQNSHTTHQKQCQKLRKQQIQLSKLLLDYQTTHKQLKLTNQDILKNGKTGLQNLRNTCYLNSALQCVLRVDKLVKYFANNDHVAHLNVDNVLGSEGHLACAFAQLVKNYYSTSRRALQPMKVLRIIAKNPQFRGAEHQDSQQFLNYFLDKLHQDLNLIKIKPYTSQIQSLNRPDQIVSQQSWQNYLLRNKSFIQQLFTGQYRSEIRCPDCDKISITFDPFMSVTLPFPKEDKYINIKGYLLTIEGYYLKIDEQVQQNMKTNQMYKRLFNQNVIAVNLFKKLIRKQWNQNLTIAKNQMQDGINMFFIKQEGWSIQINLQFYDKDNQIIAFTRRLYIKSPQTQFQLTREIYRHIRHPIQKQIGKSFFSQQEYISYCFSQNLFSYLNPIKFPLPNSIVIKMRFNLNDSLSKNPNLNFSQGSYDIKCKQIKKDYRNGINMKQLMQNFILPQKLNQDNMWYCSSCKTHKMAQKLMRLYRLPQYLIMHLKRFNHKNTKYRNLIGVQKIQTKVNLEEIQEINGQRYQLIGIVNHFGTMTYGHYTAYVKRDQWLNYDDQKVKRGRVDGDNAYLLFYKRSQ